MNWTGHVVAAPRSDLGGTSQASGASRTGIYILIGDDPDSPWRHAGLHRRRRRRRSAALPARPARRPEGKDFWERAIVLTSKDANLTKAHARYLESRFISLAEQANRTKLTNATAPPPIVLPEADVSDMEYFIAQAKIVLPVLGVKSSARHPTDTAPEAGQMGVPTVIPVVAGVRAAP